MRPFHTTLRRLLLCLAWMLTGVCAAQNQFVDQPKVQLTGGRVTSFLTGNFQTTQPGTDILSINAPTISNGISSVLVGELLNTSYTSALDNNISFTGVTNVVATLANFDGDSFTDYAFALTPAVANTPNLCVYYGTGSSISSSYNNEVSPTGSGYSSYPPPADSKSGCMAFPIQAANPIFSYIAALPLTTSSKYPQFLVEDSANHLLYVISNDGSTGSAAMSNNFKVLNVLPLADGAGPIYVSDFDGDGKTDFIVNGQTGAAATVYIGNGNGTFKAPVRYTFTHNVHSMLMQDMDGDGKPDMVVEGDNGVIEIHHGNGDGTFSSTPVGSFPSGLDGYSGNGGNLALASNIDGRGTIEILATTPIGLSVFENTGAYNLNYTLKNIYNIGSGRTSFALANFGLSGGMDLAVDGPEGIVILPGDGNGGFQSSNAFPTYSPALSAVVGKFRNTTNNPTGTLDAVVSTGAVQGQLMVGNGDGTFTPAATTTNTTIFPSGIPSTLWSNVAAGKFNSTNLDIAYTLTGPVGSGSNPSLYVQYGNGDGTFQTPVAVAPGVPGNNTFYGASVVGDFNGDGLSDIANVDAGYVDTLLGQTSTTVPFNLGMNQAASGTSLNLVAAGFFTEVKGKTTKQDLVALQGGSLIPYANSGDGKIFTPKTALSGMLPASSGLAVSALLLADVNNDGYDDVIALYHNLASVPSNPNTSTPNWLYIWYGKGDGTFSSTPFTLQLDRNFYMAAVADMDNDGSLDLVLSDGYLVAILFNQDDGTFVAGCGSFGASCSDVGHEHQEQHYLAGQGINAIVPVALAGDNKTDLVVANGGLTISNPLVLGGAAQSSATLVPNPVVNTGGITVLMNNITTLPATGTVTVYDSSYPSASSKVLEPSPYSQGFTLVAVVTPANGATTVPGGTATFYIDGVEPTSCTPYSLTVTNLPPGSPANSSATYCSIAAGNTYAVGQRTLTVVYSGDSVYSPLTITGIHTISGGTTKTALYLCAGPTASCPSTGYVKPPLVATINNMVYGQTLNGTIVVTPSDPGGAVPGNVSLNDAYNGGTPTFLCFYPCSLNSGLQLGVNVLTAVYAGDSTHSGSTSNTVTVTISADTPTVVVTGSPNPAMVGTSVTFTATVSGSYAAPAGTVSFNYGSQVLCSSQPLTPSTSGVTSTAICPTSSLPVGKDVITASYAATTDFAAANSQPFTETITPPPTGNFNITVTPNPVSLGVGYGTQLNVTVTAQNGFAQDVNLSCGNLPNEASCSFSPSLISGGSGTTSVFLNTAAPHSCGTNEPYFVGSNGGPGVLLPALAGLIAIFLPGRRRWLRALVAVLLAAGATQITGCSTCSDLGTRPAAYTFQVLGTAAGTGEVESQTVTLTVTI